MITLNNEQCRVIGVMLEKEITTPEQYPLSLNALTTGCNQKSNREPVMSLTESQVQNVVDELIDMKLLMIDQLASGRVSKYQHRFCNTQFGSLQFTEQQKAIICVLLLRGPQTPGELRTRSQRLADFANVQEAEQALEQLQDLNGQVLVQKLPREPGKRESRYVQLFCDDIDIPAFDDSSDQVVAAQSGSLANRVTELEAEVAQLKETVERLAQLLD